MLLKRVNYATKTFTNGWMVTAYTKRTAGIC